MDGKEERPDIEGAERPKEVSGNLWDRAVRAIRDISNPLIAIAVVVGLNFFLPLGAMLFVSTLNPTILGIGLFIIAGAIVLFAPPVLTTVLVGFFEARCSVIGAAKATRWSRSLVAPSILVLFVILVYPIWSGEAPKIAAQLAPVHKELGLASWVIWLGMLFGGVVFLTSDLSDEFSSDRRLILNNGTDDDTVEFDSTSRAPKPIDRTVEENGERLKLTFKWKNSPYIGFEDIGGLASIKTDVHRKVIFPNVSNRESYSRFGVRPPSGILLYGPPGTGKTLLARAIAGELGWPFLELSQADLASKWVNESSEKIRQLFDEAESVQPCVIFVDEIDSLVRSRGLTDHNEDSKIVTELLARMGEGRNRILLIAATNRPDLLDAAALRPGRFDEQFELGLPSEDDREEIFKVLLRGRHPSLTDAQYTELAALSDRLTGADIAGIINDAALTAAENEARTITFEDLSASLVNRSQGSNSSPI